MVKHISCGCKCIFNNTTWNWNQNWNNDTCQCECKKYHACKKDYSCNPGTFFFGGGGGGGGNSRYLKSIVDDWVIVCNKMTNDADSISTNMTYTIPVNVTNTVSINSNYKEVAWKK